MTAPPVPAFDATLQRMFTRDGLDSLAAHLADSCGITVAKLTKLDVGVFRVDQAGRREPLVARLFSRARPHELAEGDLAVLRYLAETGFPAERPHGDAPLTAHEGQSLLVTGFVKAVPKAQQPKYPILRLGARIGLLHTLPVPAGADRPAGALHHYAEGTLSDELRAAAGWLDSVTERAPAGAGAAIGELRAALMAADGGDGLPEALVHPDPVPKNAIFTATGPVLVDWTSAGRGPRLASLTLILQSGWAAPQFLRGYFRKITLTDDERARLGGLLFSRKLISMAFDVCREPATAAAQAAKLAALRETWEARAAELLAGPPAG